MPHSGPPGMPAPAAQNPHPPHARGYSHHGHTAAINDHSPQRLVPGFPRQVQLEGCIQGLVVPLKAGHCAVRLRVARRLPRGPLPSPQDPLHLRLVLTTGSRGAAGLGTLPFGLPLALWEGGVAP